MRNSKSVPIAALALAGIMAVAATISFLLNGETDPFHLSALEIGLVGIAVTLAIFGVQGIVSIVSEGEELRPGKSPPRLTDELTGTIVVFSIFLALAAVLLLIGIPEGLSTVYIGIVAGIGCIILGTLLVFYKEAFLGDEAVLDDRDDGIPW
jgi:hypothetical protein